MSHKIPAAYARQYESDDRSSRKDRYTSYSPGLSTYYKERFGSRSPEEYQNLRFSHMSKSIASDDIRDIILDEFRKYGPFEVKIVHNPEDNQRLAYVNFQDRGMARKARRDCFDFLCDELGKHLKIDPAGVVRDQDGRQLDRHSGAGPPRGHHDNFNGQQQQRYPARDSGYPSSHRSPYQFQRGGGRGSAFDMRGPPRTPIVNGPPRRAMPRDGENTLDDPMIARTLFCGNLAYEVRDSDIVRMFEPHGKMGSVEIKRPIDGSTPYAFVTFDKIEHALAAKIAEDDTPLVDGGPRVRIGWGKSIPQQRLWVYGLGEWATEDLIFREFDRYGVIDKVDFVREGDKAFITYDSIQSATDACKAMKGFPLGGKDKTIRVDFACAYECLDLKPPSSSVNYDPHGERNAPSSARKRDRSRTSSTPSSRSRSPSTKKERRSPSPSPRRSRRTVSLSSDDDKRTSRRKHKHSKKSSKKTSKHYRRRRSSDTSSSRSRSRERSSRERRRERGSKERTRPVRSASSDHQRQRTISGESDKDAPRDISPSRSPTPELAANTIAELEAIREPCWTGVIVLKKSAYPVKLYTMQCDDLPRVLEDKLNDTNREAVRLHITQRLPWMANNLQEKFGESAAGRAGYFLAIPSEETPTGVTDLQVKPLIGLVAYLQDKQAAGVVSLSGASAMYTFPKCLLAETVLNRVASKITVLDHDQCLFLALAL